MSARKLALIRNALKKPPQWLIFVGFMLVVAAIAKGSVWAAPLGVILGAMAGERDAARRVSAALLKSEDGPG
jgi:hypothetical protein